MRQRRLVFRRVVGTMSVMLLVTGLMTGTAAAEGLPSTPIDPVFVETPDMNRVYGQIDQLAYTVSQEVEDQTPTIQTDMLNKVWGVVQDPTGTVQSGVTVVLDLLPSGGYDDLPGGSQVFELAKSVTDAAGEFFLDVPTTEEVLAEAEYLNGTVNMMLTAVKDQAEGRGVWSTYFGAGAIYSSMVEFGPGVGGLAMAPVNVGVLTVEEAKALTGTSGLAETPGNDPEDPSTTRVDRPNVFVAGTGKVVGSVPVVSEPYVEVPSGYTQTYVAYPPNLTEVAAVEDEHDPGNEDSGDNRCKRPENQGSWITDRLEWERRYQPVGEVHSETGTKVKYVYSERGNTRLGVGIKPEGGNWKISGAVNITNDAGAENEKDWRHDSFARRVEAEFIFERNYKTWCPDGYDEVRGPHAIHYEEVVGKQWTGALRFGSRDISGNDNGMGYEEADSEGRTMSFFAGDTFTKTKGKTFKYTVDVEAFGVALNAESVNDISHTMVLVAGHSREQWHLFGDVTVPADAANHAIYISF